MKTGIRANLSGMAPVVHALPALKMIAFERYARKLNDRDPVAWPLDQCQLAVREYQRFLLLKIQHPETSLVPTELMDAMWHEHILDTMHYGEDTARLFGRFLHHCPEYGDGSDPIAEGVGRTAQLYEAVFGTMPAGLTLARCQDKTCHAPTPCRCR